MLSEYQEFPAWRVIHAALTPAGIPRDTNFAAIIEEIVTPEADKVFEALKEANCLR